MLTNARSGSRDKKSILFVVGVYDLNMHKIGFRTDEEENVKIYNHTSFTPKLYLQNKISHLILIHVTKVWFTMALRTLGWESEFMFLRTLSRLDICWDIMFNVIDSLCYEIVYLVCDWLS